jgi:hypothetical protein
LQIRKDIRDVFDKDEAAVQKSFQRLHQVIGYAVSCNIEWQMLWAELESAYPDKSTFVPTVASVVETWCESLTNRLEDDKFEAWTEELLSKLEPVSEIKLFLQVGIGNSICEKLLKSCRRLMIKDQRHRGRTRGLHSPSSCPKRRPRVQPVHHQALQATSRFCLILHTLEGQKKLMMLIPCLKKTRTGPTSSLSPTAKA